MPSAARPNPILLTAPRRVVDPRHWFERFELGAPLRADQWLWGCVAALILLGGILPQANVESRFKAAETILRARSASNAEGH